MIKQYVKKIKDVPKTEKNYGNYKDCLDRNLSGLSFADIPNFRTVSDLFNKKQKNIIYLNII